MTDRLEHPPHLPVSPLVEDELEPGRAERAARARAPSARRRARLPPRAGAGRRRPARPRPRRRRPSRPRSADAPAGARAGRRSSAGARRSCRDRAVPTGTTRTSPPTRSTTVGRPSGSRAVVIVSARLVEEHVAEPLGADRRGRRPGRRRRPDERVELAASAVDRHAPRLDQLVGAAPRGDAGPREVGVQSHRAPFSPATLLRRGATTPSLTRRLADLVVGYGANVQPGQIVGVTTYTGKEALTREVARAAYERGARWVDVVTFDPWVKRAAPARTPTSRRSSTSRRGSMERLEWLSAEHAARVTLNGPAAPDALDGIDPARAGRDVLPYLPEHRRGRQPRARRTGASPRRRRPAGRSSSIRSSTPDEALRPALGGDRAHLPARQRRPRGGLARARAHARRRGGAPHRAALRRDPPPRPGHRPDGRPASRRPSGTPRTSRPSTGSAISRTSRARRSSRRPIPRASTGHVTATRPLELYGALIDGIRVEFEGGRAVEIDADRGADTLRAIAAKDDGALAARRARARRRRGPHRPARHGLLRDAARRERREPHRARQRVHARRGVRRRPRAGQHERDPRRLHDRLARARRRRHHADGAVVPLLRSGAWQV